LAATQVDLMRGVARPFVAMMTGQNHGTACRDEALDALVQASAGVDVDPCKYLIEQQQPRSQYEGAGQQHASRLTI
jgi:hypothetical protein